MEEALWDVNDAAAYLKESVKGVYAAAARGSIPGVVHVGRLVRFDPDAIKAWIKDQQNSRSDQREEGLRKASR
jgi:excisionase family DNA binding protein